MEKSKKTMLIVAGVLLLLNALSHLTIIIISFNNIDFFTVYIFNAFEELGITTFDFEAFESAMQSVIYMAYVALPACLFGVFVIFNLMNKSPEKLERLKPLIIFTTIIVLLFGNIISFFLILFALLVNTQTQVQPKPQESFENVVTKEIESIRNLYNKGAITKDEYDKLVKELFNKIELR